MNKCMKGRKIKLSSEFSIIVLSFKIKARNRSPQACKKLFDDKIQLTKG